MGVNGLWDILAPAGTPVSLAKLAIDAFERNSSGRRAYRVGIDASIWYKHATYSAEGENPELRLLFFRVKELARLPLLPLFIFDGHNRPKVKRGGRMGKSGSHGLSRNIKTLLDVFGIGWREAEGEAEAELAFLNQMGVIDAIMTDDVDAFLFGATTIIRNPIMGLTGNTANPALNSDGKPSKSHVMQFRVEDLRLHPQIRMTRGAMILFALLSGGDYDKGVDKIGKATAYALARCGFGDELLAAALTREYCSLHNFLPEWRHRVNNELRSNSRGFLKRLSPGLCLPDAFPNLNLLDKYVNPARRERGLQGVWKDGELSLPRAASFCEKFFEWGTRSIIVKRFRTLLWEASIVRVLRRAVLEQDKKSDDSPHGSVVPDWGIQSCQRPAESELFGTSVSLIPRYLNPEKVDHYVERISAAFVNKGPSTTGRTHTPVNPKSFIVMIHSERRYVSTDKSLEYRIEVDPETLVELTLSGVKGTRPDKDLVATIDNYAEDNAEDSDDGGCTRNNAKRKTKKAPPDPLSTFRMWCPAAILRCVAPQLVHGYELAQEEKKRKMTRRTSIAGETASRKSRVNGKCLTTDSDSEKEASVDEETDGLHPSPRKKRRAAVDQDTHNTASLSSPLREIRISKVSSLRAVTQDSSSTSSRHGPQRVSFKSTNSFDSDIIRDRESARCSSSAYLRPSATFASNLPSHATQPSRAHGDDWDANETSSLFLFSIPDPCDPTLVDRVDLRDERQDPVFRWAELSSVSGSTPHDDEDDDLTFGNEDVARLFRRNFRLKSQDQAGRCKTRANVDEFDLHDNIGKKGQTIASTSSDTVRRVGVMSADQSRSRVEGGERPSVSSTPLRPDHTSIGKDHLLFLPSLAPSPNFPGRSLSQPTPRSSDFSSNNIGVTSSDDDYVSFEVPPSSSLPPSSPISSQDLH